MNRGTSVASHLGAGIFDTIIVHNQGGHWKAFAFEDHYQRLMCSAKAFSFTYPSLSEWQREVHHRVSDDITGASTLLIRTSCVTEGWSIECCSWQPSWEINKGISLASVMVERVFPHHKTMSALPSVMARKMAQSQGADEALLIDFEGHVREGAWSSFFWITQSGTLKTVAKNVLPGITALHIEKLSQPCTKISSILLEDLLLEAAECFVTQATHGVVPVTQIIKDSVTYNYSIAKTSKIALEFKAYKESLLQII